MEIDEDELMALGEHLRDALKPERDLEDLLVEQIVAANWRLRRLRRVEASISDVMFYTGRPEHVSHPAPTYTSSLGKSFIGDADSSDAFSKLSRYETAIERRLFKTLHERERLQRLQRLQAAHRAEGSVASPAALELGISGISEEGL